MKRRRGGSPACGAGPSSEERSTPRTSPRSASASARRYGHFAPPVSDSDDPPEVPEQEEKDEDYEEDPEEDPEEEEEEAYADDDEPGQPQRSRTRATSKPSAGRPSKRARGGGAKPKEPSPASKARRSVIAELLPHGTARVPPAALTAEAAIRRLQKRARDEWRPAGAGFDGSLLDEAAPLMMAALTARGEAAGAKRPELGAAEVAAYGSAVQPCFRGAVSWYEEHNAARRAARAERRAAAAEEVGRGALAEAEGLRLHLSSSTSTGYKGVHSLASGRFRAVHWVGERQVTIGTFDTAAEAAAAYARSVGEYQPPAQPPPTVAEEAEGLRLHLSSRSTSTGYKGVHEHRFGRFRAVHWVGGRKVTIGTFDTAAEAAAAYARSVGEYQPPAQPPPYE